MTKAWTVVSAPFEELSASAFQLVGIPDVGVGALLASTPKSPGVVGVPPPSTARSAPTHEAVEFPWCCAPSGP
jgi:hypothetical protein